MTRQLESLDEQQQSSDPDPSQPVNNRDQRGQPSPREAQLEQLIAEFQQLKQAFVAEQEGWRDDHRRLQKELSNQRTSLEQELAQVSEHRRELKHARDQLAKQRQESRDGSGPPAPGTGCGPQPGDQNRDGDQLFARLRAMSLIEDSSSPNQNGFQTEKHEAREHEESIDDYMTRLLKRVRGVGEEKPQPIEPSPNCIADDPPHRPILISFDAIPRSSAPEKTHGFAAMRELANLNTRIAIAKHHTRRRADHVTRLLMIAGATAAAGLLLLFCTHKNSSLFFFVGLTSLIAAIYAFARAVILARKARLEKQRHHEHTQTRLEAFRESENTNQESATPDAQFTVDCQSS